MGFDQMMVFYNHFCVTDARLRVVFRSAGTALTGCIRVDADSTPITVIDRIVEFGGCVTSALEFKSGYGANKELSLNVSIPKLQGVPLQAILADVNLRGTAVSSPSEISYFHIAIWDTGAATGASQIDVILEQKATFTEPRDISQSLKKAPSPPVGCQERKQGGWFSN